MGAVVAVIVVVVVVVYVLAVAIGVALMVVEGLCSRLSTVYQARKKAGTDQAISVYLLHQWHWM